MPESAATTTTTTASVRGTRILRRSRMTGERTKLSSTARAMGTNTSRAWDSMATMAMKPISAATVSTDVPRAGRMVSGLRSKPAARSGGRISIVRYAPLA
ncbi:MAG: hypothetical protein AB1698_00080 [Pseudomonadota bacterium]